MSIAEELIERLITEGRWDSITRIAKRLGALASWSPRRRFSPAAGPDIGEFKHAPNASRVVYYFDNSKQAEKLYNAAFGMRGFDVISSPGPMGTNKPWGYPVQHGRWKGFWAMPIERL